ncbi:hypothetical protein Poly41_17920 [Novipirellula artificiosorum]|uniref:Type II secretion system protein G n=2 Tax=Novipirellula artificiosorum TaxID=2528016 RepID=A0A5C6DYP6_9BACT|nr:hypothetical protein Poly41_17920 [Novipirellula artificiosorum]
MVILIVGIVVVMTVPQITRTPPPSRTTTTHHQIAVLRKAIEMYHHHTGHYPPADRLPEAITALLNGPFPVPALGSPNDDGSVYYDRDPDSSTVVVPNPDLPSGWAYKPANGTLKLNVAIGQRGFNW